MSWTQEALAAYAAGIIDGEGSIVITWGPYRAYRRLAVAVGLSTKGQPVLDFLHKHFGGCLSRGYKNESTYGRAIIKQWFTGGTHAKDFLCKIRKYLVLKALQADVAIGFQEMLDASIGHEGDYRKWTKSMMLAAEQYAITMKELNVKGVKT